MTQPQPSDFTSSVLTANGQRIHICEAGEGPLVLFLHGFPESWYSWRHQLVALRDAGYRAVAMSGRGYGRSSRPEQVADYRITELVGDCVGVVQALGAATAVIVGHDWGAQVAWAAAWTRPDVFRAVAGVSVPFPGRALTGLTSRSGLPIGEERPADIHRAIAGADLTFYMDYIAEPGRAEKEIEQDVRGWLRDGYYSLSASAPLPPELQGVDLTALDDAAIAGILRGAATCIPPGARWRDRFLTAPDVLPGWLPEDVFDFYVRQLEYTGFTGALNWYRCLDLDWELLAPYAHQPVRVPGMYVAGERDPVTIWCGDAISQMVKTVPELHASRILPDCGHWVGEERPGETNSALLDFLKRLDN
jgi:pimeloyl-ACP methyl ester carboxylesterase